MRSVSDSLQLAQGSELTRAAGQPSVAGLTGLRGCSGIGRSSQAWRCSAHTACSGIGKSRSAKAPAATPIRRSEEHTPELQSLMRISYAVFCLKKKTQERHDRPNKRHNYTHKCKYYIHPSNL